MDILRPEQAMKDKGYFHYCKQDGYFDPAEDGLVGKGGKVSFSRNATLFPDQRLWGRRTARSFATDVLMVRRSQNPFTPYIASSEAFSWCPARYTLPPPAPLKFYSHAYIALAEMAPDEPGAPFASPVGRVNTSLRSFPPPVLLSALGTPPVAEV